MKTLDPSARDFARVVASLCEEFEAVGVYHERMIATADPQLKQMFKHHRDEEIEHGLMALAWMMKEVPDVAHLVEQIIVPVQRSLATGCSERSDAHPETPTQTNPAPIGC